MVTPAVVVFARNELDLIAAFAGCSLDEKPGSNWVQDAGGLPDYICRIAKAVRKTGKTTSQAISIAVSRVKVWATGKGVDKDTQAKAAAAVAEWEKLRAKSHAKSDAKKVAASNTGGDILTLSAKITSFNVETVRRAWESQTDAWIKKYRAAFPDGDGPEPRPVYSYIRELWTDHVIVEARGDTLFRVDYAVDADNNVTFDEPVQVKMQYVTVAQDDMVGSDISDDDLRRILATVGPCHTSNTDKVRLSITEKPSALQQVLGHQITQPRTALGQILDASIGTPIIGFPSLLTPSGP